MPCLSATNDITSASSARPPAPLSPLSSPPPIPMYSHCVIFMRPSVEHVSCPRAACARVCDSERASNVQPSRTQNPRVSCSGISSVALIASLKKCFGNNCFMNGDASSSFFLLRHQSAFLPVVSCFRRRFREETREGPKASGGPCAWQKMSAGVFWLLACDCETSTLQGI